MATKKKAAKKLSGGSGDTKGGSVLGGGGGAGKGKGSGKKK